jgi:hypothetical protein
MQPGDLKGSLVDAPGRLRETVEKVEPFDAAAEGGNCLFTEPKIGVARPTVAPDQVRGFVVKNRKCSEVDAGRRGLRHAFSVSRWIVGQGSLYFDTQ